jgi:hypothetical protein
MRGDAEYPFRSADKTLRTANVLNCFENDRSSKFIGEVNFKKYTLRNSRKSKLKFM